MSYRGVRNWPPLWTHGYFDNVKTFRSDVGIFKHVVRHHQLPNRCYLAIEYASKEYVGCLLFDDDAFCSRIGDLLECYLGCSIKDIGDLDVAFTDRLAPFSPGTILSRTFAGLARFF